MFAFAFTVPLTATTKCAFDEFPLHLLLHNLSHVRLGEMEGGNNNK